MEQNSSLTLQLKNCSPKFRIKWLQLARTKNVGPRAFIKLMEMFGDPEIALCELPNLSRRGGRLESIKIPSEESIEREIERTEKLDAKIILSCEENYPILLKKITDYPAVIVAKGRIDLLNKPSLGIVGARNCSTNGCIVAHNIAKELGQNGYIINSGLAKGIDSAVHFGSLKYGTVGVIASGIDITYPNESIKLYQLLYKEGLVITEHAVSVAPIAQYFPQRNRIISGLSMGVVIIEASKKSGTLITAKFALEQGREVFAVPGSPLDPRCSGTNSLIKQGAILAENAEDILNEVDALVSKFYRSSEACYENYESDFGSMSKKSDSITNYKPNELVNFRKYLLTKLSYSPIKLDKLMSELGDIPQDIINLLLLELELAGKIEYCFGNSVCLIGKSDF